MQIKKIISISLTVLLVLFTIPMSSIQAINSPENIFENYKYTISGNFATITGLVTSPEGEVTVPDNINGYIVTEIGAKAFQSEYKITNLILPSTLVSIKESAFEHCTKLTDVKIPKTLKSIGHLAFNNTKLSNIYISDLSAWCNIETSEFSYGGKTLFLNNEPITTLKIPSDVNRINNHVFNGYDCITSVYIPDNVKEIGEYAFAYSKNISKINFEYGVETIKKCAFMDCVGLTEIVVPDSVISLGEAAFYECSYLKKATLSDNIEIIERDTFYDCRRMKEINLPKSVKSIGFKAFESCYVIGNLDFPNELNYIAEYAFSNCRSLNKVDLPDNLTKIETGTFYNCYKLQEVIFHEGLKIIGNSAFANSNLLKVDLPQGLTTLDGNVFYNCKSLTTAYIPDSVTTIKPSFDKQVIIFGNMFSCAQKYASDYSLTFVATGIYKPSVKLVGSTKVVLEENGSLEYSSDCINWQTSGLVEGLKKNEDNIIYYRANGNNLVSYITVIPDGMDEISNPNASHLVWARKTLFTFENANNLAADFNRDYEIDMLDIIHLKNLLLT